MFIKNRNKQIKQTKTEDKVHSLKKDRWVVVMGCM